MDLGATVCTPRSPACIICPWSDACAARRDGIAETLPRKRAKAATPTRYGVAFWMVNDGRVLLRRRAAKGLLGGMIEVPSTDWRAAGWPRAEAEKTAPLALRWRPLPGVVAHTFTHFHLELSVFAAAATAAQAKRLQATGGVWTALADVEDGGLPSVMRKVARHAMKHT